MSGSMKAMVAFQTFIDWRTGAVKVVVKPNSRAGEEVRGR